MKISIGASLVTLSASVYILTNTPHAIAPKHQLATTIGYTDGKQQCNHANGCNLRITFSKCLACCMANCPHPWYDGCVDECIATFDPKDVYGALLDATDTISTRKSEGFGEAKSMLIAVQASKDRRLAHVARLLAVESQDYGGYTGILQER